MIRDGKTIHMLSCELYAGLEKEGDSSLPPRFLSAPFVVRCLEYFDVRSLADSLFVLAKVRFGCELFCLPR
jgi:hypothetical protein